MIFHLAPIRMINKDQQVTSQLLDRVWGEGNLHSLLLGFQSCIVTVEMCVENPQNGKNKCTIWPSYSSFWHSLKVLAILLHIYLLRHTIVALFIITRAQKWSNFPSVHKNGICYMYSNKTMFILKIFFHHFNKCFMSFNPLFQKNILSISNVFHAHKTEQYYTLIFGQMN